MKTRAGLLALTKKAGRWIRATRLGNRITVAVLRQYLRARMDREHPLVEVVKAASRAYSKDLSLILLDQGAPEETLNCLLSTCVSSIAPAETIIVGRKRSAALDVVIGQLPRIRFLELSDISGVGTLLLEAARASSTEHLLYVHAGLEDVAGWIPAAAQLIRENFHDCSLMSGMLIGTDGKIVEAGSIVDAKGQLVVYGEHEPPSSGRFHFARQVDCCTDLFFLTRRDILLEFGAGCVSSTLPFPIQYSLALRARGRKIFYEPLLRAIQFHPAERLRIRNGRLALAVSNPPYVRRAQGSASSSRAFLGPDLNRTADDRVKRVLLIEDRVPHVRLGRGFPRSNLIVRQLVADGCAVTIYPLLVGDEGWREAYSDIPREVEILMGYGLNPNRGREVLEQRWNEFDRIMVTRPDNMRWLRRILSSEYVASFSHKVIYDAEALFARRRALLQELRGNVVTDEVEQVDQEVALAKGCVAVTCVSRAEAEEFRSRGISNVYVLGHAHDVAPTAQPFASRKGLLFVGSLSELNSPNAEGLVWFVENVWPNVRTYRNPGIELTIAGTCSPEVRDRLVAEGITLAGAVPDLSHFYDCAKVFVAPVRYGAGIPLKLTEAAAHGVPIVTTSLLASQLEWKDGREALVADEPEAFAQKLNTLLHDEHLWHALRDAALARVVSEYSVSSFTQTLRSVFDIAEREESPVRTALADPATAAPGIR